MGCRKIAPLLQAGLLEAIKFKMKESLYIGIVVSMQLVASFCIQLLIIRIIGVGSDTDAYIAAQAVPLVSSTIIITALQSVWLPRLAVLSDDIAAWRSEQSVAQGQGALLGGGVFISLILCISLWMPLLFPGFGAEQIQSAIGYSSVLLIAAAFTTQSALTTVALRAIDRFVAAEVVSLVGTLIALVVMYFVLPQWGLYGAVWVVLGRSILVYFIQLQLAMWPAISLRRGLMCRETWVLMRPLLFGASLYKTSPLVDRYWASQAGAGGITILNLAQTVMSSLATVLERSICIPIIPTFARQVKNQDYRGLRSTYRKGAVKVTAIVLTLGLGLALTRALFLSLATAVLKVGPDIALSLWWACILLLGYLHAAVVGALLVGAFYAMSNTKLPVQIGVVGFTLSLFIKGFCFTYFGMPGLLGAISVYYLLNMVAMLISLEVTLNKRVAFTAAPAR